jgi:hypothetical protein
MLFIATILFSCSNSTVESQSEALKEPSIFIKNSELYFNGEITESSVNHAFSLINSYQGEIHSMNVNSLGGDIKPAMKLGIWMYDNNISLTIHDFCFSSCANYFVTAAKSVHIAKGAIVGWHGGATQKFSLPKNLPLSAKKRAEKAMQDVIEIEQAFFEHIGVQEQITVLGQYNDSALRKNTPSCVEAHDKGELQGWTYTLDDLKIFGVDNVTSENREPPTMYHGEMMICVIKVK